MRVIAGSARGRRLSSPAGQAIRPTSDRVRESMFNRLDSLGLIRGAVVLDLFAGTGALGIEALSRGAESVTFVDSDVSAVKIVRANLDALGFDATVHRMAASQFLDGAVNSGSDPYDLALLDPPYDFSGWPELLQTVPASHCVIESGQHVSLPGGWRELRRAAYGRTHVAVIKRR